MIEKFSKSFLFINHGISSMSENQVIAYIAKELGVSPEEIPVTDFKCCTCFNILRDQFFRMVFPFLHK